MSTGRYVESDPIGIEAGTNTYTYALASPLVYIDPRGQGAFKIVILCEKGLKVIRTVGFKDAVRALRRGENVLSETEQKAKQVADAAGNGAGKPVKDTPHREGYRPHYHMTGRAGGHSFYSIASFGSLSHYKSCDSCISGYYLEAMDLFNPLSAPKDLMDLADDLSSDE